MSAVAHRLEDVLDGLRMGRVRLEHQIVLLLDEAVRFPFVGRRHARPGQAGPNAPDPVGGTAANVYALHEAPLDVRTGRIRELCDRYA